MTKNKVFSNVVVFLYIPFLYIKERIVFIQRYLITCTSQGNDSNLNCLKPKSFFNRISKVVRDKRDKQNKNPLFVRRSSLEIFRRPMSRYLDSRLVQDEVTDKNYPAPKTKSLVL